MEHLKEFTVVRGKRRNKYKTQNSSSPVSTILPFQCDVDLNKVMKKIEENVADLIISDFYHSFEEQLLQCCSRLFSGDVTADGNIHCDGDVDTTENVMNEKVQKGCKTNGSENKLHSSRLVAESDSPSTSCGCGVEEIVCYGIGSVATCLIARNQLALLLALRKKLKVPLDMTSLYDPMLISAEIDVLRKLGMNVIDANEEGKRKCHKQTLFYMPHCGKSLYNNLLWANWSHNLGNIIILGNSFSNMVESNPKRQMEVTAKYILSIHHYTTEVPLPQTYRFTDVFNDLSIHTFPREKLLRCPEDFWLDRTEPEYDCNDVEFITNKHIR